MLHITKGITRRCAAVRSGVDSNRSSKSSMTFYHVRIIRKSSRSRVETKLDFTLEGLEERVLGPYRRGQPITINGKSIWKDDIERVWITETDQDSSFIRPHVEQKQKEEALKNATGPVFVAGGTPISVEWLIANVGEEVTDEFITGPPGSESNVQIPRRTKSHPMTALLDQIVTNESLREASCKLFTDGHYARTVEEAFKCLNNAVKDKSGHFNLDGDKLMRTVFSANSPILKINDFKSNSEKDEQRGYMDIYAGVMTGIRNPRAHEHRLADQPNVALELLVLANHLMRRLDGAARTGHQPRGSRNS